MAPAAYPRVALCDGLRRCEGSASIATAAVRRQMARTLTRRAGPALPSYLALHHAGFSVPHALLRERWALTPPFHPYQRIVRRRLAVFLRDATVPTRGGLIFCGTIRERIRVSQAETCVARSAPLALPGALPLLPMTRDGVRTFLPPDRLATIQPAITRLTRWRHYSVNRGTSSTWGTLGCYPLPCFS
jgi:hypothetical protein